jgi:hypothetical protein
MRNLKSAGVVFIVALFSRITLSNTAVNWVATNLSFLPEASFEGDYKIFALQKNDYLREKYENETNVEMDLAFLSFKERFYWMFRGEVRGGFGKSPYGMLLHPYDVAYALIPTLEYRSSPFHFDVGLDHRCFHLTDQRPTATDPVVYWNKVIFRVNSPSRREHPFNGRFIDTVSWNGFNRLTWSFTWGYYISNFFGLVDPIKLMSITSLHYLHDFQLNVRFGLLRWKWGALSLTGASMFGFKQSEDGAYWSQETGVETLFALRPFDSSFFVNYILDKGLFNSKDRLLEFGIRVIK